MDSMNQFVMGATTLPIWGDVTVQRYQSMYCNHYLRSFHYERQYYLKQ
jgi:hypothetical protein